MAAVMVAGSAAAQTARADFAIAAGDLGPALAAYAKQSGVELFYQSRVVQGRQTSGLNGSYEPQEGLNQLISGTGLVVTADASGVLVVREAADPQSGSAAGDGAEGTVDTLVVTAQKREEDIQDVPIAISAFTQEDLTRSQVAGGPDLMTQVPNMTFTKTNFTSYSIQIRGIGTQAISATTDPAVAVAFNNTPFIRNHFFEQEFYDLERVEVLRGPQGTLYGRNATAGVVNVISGKPKFRFESKVAGDLANYGSSRLEGMINIPLVDDKVALRIAGAWTKRDGFVKNSLTGEQTDGRDLWSGRVSLAVAPNDWFRADLIYEHFEEDDDRLRTGKQLCNKSPLPLEVEGVPVPQTDGGIFRLGADNLAQGCLAASLYSPDSFQTPNGYALAYYGAAGQIGAPTNVDLDPYLNSAQSRDLREIETHLTPDYEASADLVQLQLSFDLPANLTLQSETAFARDYIFSFSDFNRFNTRPGVLNPTTTVAGNPIVNDEGVFCDPQLGCTDRLAAGDLAMANSQHFSQEFRLGSDFEGPFNFSLGANFLRYDTEDKYYVFINTLTALAAQGAEEWVPGVSTSYECFETNVNSDAAQKGYVWGNPNVVYNIPGGGYPCYYIDPNNIHNLNDLGRNYFLSKNPYHLLSYAIFGEGYYQVASNLKVTGGLRWTVDKKTAPQHPSWLLAYGSYGTAVRKVVEQEWREPTGRVAIDWKPDLPFTDETLIYGSYVRGYKAGGANPPPPIIVLPPICPPNCETLDFPDILLNKSLTHPETFEAEYVNAFELGTKNTLSDGMVTANVAAFYYDYTGYQISQIVNRSAVNLNFDAEIWGLELELDWRPLENLRLGFKGGYENTRMADGSQAIDLIDRTAGNPDWILLKPTPPGSSNCIIPTWLAAMAMNSFVTSFCESYLVGLDPFTSLPYVPNPQFGRDPSGVIVPIDEVPSGGVDLTGYPGFDPSSANNGEGFLKDLSGNELPNAPDYTATITVDYTLPLPNEWLVTLHTDLYYQSEAWTRIFNTEGYDKLKAFSNVNLAAIFTNEDAGWNVMAYVKNVFDRDSITGAFLNSDDTGLTTNVFLTEPRLYGLRVTKQWTDSGPLGSWFGGKGPLRLEVGGYYGEFNEDHEPFAPATLAYLPADFPYPSHVQSDLDWGSAGGIKLTYQQPTSVWSVSGAIRYGRAGGQEAANVKQSVPGGYQDFSIIQPGAIKYIDPAEQGKYSYADLTAKNEETHTVVDFMVGRDFGLGAASSTLSAGMRYAHLESVSSTQLHVRPDLYVPPEEVVKYGLTMHRVHGDLDANREFSGKGLVADWDISWPLLGDPDANGRLNVDLGLGGGVLWGKQKVQLAGEVHGDYLNLGTKYSNLQRFYIDEPYVAPIHDHRTKNVTVPTAEVRLGLSYDVGRTTISGGYRWERYFDAIDGGIEERQAFDRDINGAYFKVSVGFGR